MSKGEFLYIRAVEFMGFLKTRGLELDENNEVIIDPEVEYYPTGFRFFRDLYFLFPPGYSMGGRRFTRFLTDLEERIKNELPTVFYKIYVEHKRKIYSYIDDFSYIRLVGIGLIDKNINPHKRIFSRRF